MISPAGCIRLFISITPSYSIDAYKFVTTRCSCLGFLSFTRKVNLFFSNSSQDSWLAIIYYGATKPICKEVTWFFLLYRARLLFRPSRSFPKVKHLHIIKLLMEGKKLLLLRKCWRNGVVAQKVQKSKKEVKLSFCIRGVMIKFPLHN